MCTKVRENVYATKRRVLKALQYCSTPDDKDDDLMVTQILRVEYQVKAKEHNHIGCVNWIFPTVYFDDVL